MQKKELENQLDEIMKAADRRQWGREIRDIGLRVVAALVGICIWQWGYLAGGVPVRVTPNLPRYHLVVNLAGKHTGLICEQQDVFEVRTRKINSSPVTRLDCYPDDFDDHIGPIRHGYFMR